MNAAPFRTLDLFAGCGGMTRGFLDTGAFSVVGAVEENLAAAATYAANFGEDHTFQGDVAEYLDVPEADLVIGGPPCQGFSNLGKKDPDDARNKLYTKFVDIVVASGAEMFVFENVDRFSRTVEYELLRAETAPGGRLANFSTQLFSLNAADFGVAQRRIRSIIVGSRIGPVRKPRHLRHRDPDSNQRSWRTVRDAIGHLEHHVANTVLPARTVALFNRDIKGMFTLSDLHVGRHYEPLSLLRYDCVAPGRSRFDLPDDLKYECWKRATSGATDVLGRLQWDLPSVTIRTEFNKPEKGRYLHPQWEQDGSRVNRALTHAEAALLQGFDHRHVWCGSKTEIAKQIGNAVPPPLAKALGYVVKRRLIDG